MQKWSDVGTVALVAMIAQAEPADAGQERINAAAEVTAALYHSAATLAAYRQVTDSQLSALSQRIDALETRVRKTAGQTSQLRVALKRAQDEFVVQLAQKDRAYSAVIAQFRQTVTDITSTPEGAIALRKYNEGHVEEAFLILDRIAEANQAARKIRADVETAADRRLIANLAYDAALIGSKDKDFAISRYQEILNLDNTVLSDWIHLLGLYNSKFGDEYNGSIVESTRQKALLLFKDPIEREQINVAATTCPVPPASLSPIKIQ